MLAQRNALAEFTSDAHDRIDGVGRDGTIYSNKTLHYAVNRGKRAGGWFWPGLRP